LQIGVLVWHRHAGVDSDLEGSPCAEFVHELESTSSLASTCLLCRGSIDFQLGIKIDATQGDGQDGVSCAIPSLATKFSTIYESFLSDLFHYCSKTKARLIGTCPDGVRLRAVRPSLSVHLTAGRGTPERAAALPLNRLLT
jgi:hypothetical protein